jgi:hypothetical protein
VTRLLDIPWNLANRVLTAWRYSRPLPIVVH